MNLYDIEYMLSSLDTKEDKEIIAFYEKKRDELRKEVNEKLISKGLNTDVNKMVCITNINSMRLKCGLNELDIESQLKKDYNSLHEYQNELISHYNQALRNAKIKTI